MKDSKAKHSSSRRNKGTYTSIAKTVGLGDGPEHSSSVFDKRKTVLTTGMTAVVLSVVMAAGWTIGSHNGVAGMAQAAGSNIPAVRNASTEVSRGYNRQPLKNTNGDWGGIERLNVPYSQTSNETDALSSLKTAIDNGNKLYSDSNGKVADDNTRSALKTAVDDASKAIQGKTATSVIDVGSFNALSQKITSEIGSVNDSINAKQAAQARAAVNNSSSGGSSSLGATTPVGEMQQWFHDYLLSNGYTEADFSAGVWIINHESGWNVHATNASSGAYGLPQSLPGSKMASAGADWQNNYQTQLKWFIGYCQRYSGIQGAYNFWQIHHWY